MNNERDDAALPSHPPLLSCLYQITVLGRFHGDTVTMLDFVQYYERAAQSPRPPSITAGTAATIITYHWHRLESGRSEI